MCNQSACSRNRLGSLLQIIAACAIVLGALGLWINWELLPGTYYRDAKGFPHGTGTESYDYDNGQLMLKEWYHDGLLYRSTWYHPDGTVIATEECDKSTGGVGYYLRQDGTIKSKYTYTYSPSDQMYIADGEATFYRVDGTVEEVVNYSEGSPCRPSPVRE